VNQQVNLYHPIFRKQEKKFSAVAMLQAGVVMFVGVALLYAFSWWRVTALHSQMVNMDQQQVAAVKRLEDISRRFPPREPDPALADKVQQLEQHVVASERAQDILEHNAFGSTSGYSGYLIALARQQIPGLWLTRVSVSGAGKDVTLEGRSIVPDFVPRFLQKLSTEKALTDTDFHVFRLDRPERGSKKGGLEPYVEFVIKSSDGQGAAQSQS